MIDLSEVKIFVTKDGEKITYEDLLREVYENNQDTKQSIRDLVDQMVSLIKHPSDAMMVMAHVTMMLDTKVKNDDLLVKLASILSRLIQQKTEKASGGDWEISDEEKRQLLQEAESVLDKK